MSGDHLRAAFTLVVVLATTDTVSAHRLDEYLQAARIAIEPDRVELQLDLTPGAALADSVVKEVDRDGDGAITAREAHRFARQVLAAVDVRLDEHRLAVVPDGSSFPSPGLLRSGDGTIQLQARARLPDRMAGSHQLGFRNAYREDVSVYLVNALVPSSSRISVVSQRRDAAQRAVTIAYRVREPAPGPLDVPALLVSGGLAIGVTALLVVSSRRRWLVVGSW